MPWPACKDIKKNQINSQNSRNKIFLSFSFYKKEKLCFFSRTFIYNLMEEEIIMYKYLYYFFIYSFLGWCLEVCYAALNTGKFINRGFLNGPYCPIYGVGVVIIILFVFPLRKNIFVLLKKWNQYLKKFNSIYLNIKR